MVKKIIRTIFRPFQSASGKVLRPFRSRRREVSRAKRRVQLILLAVFVLAFLAGNLDYPNYWDKAVDYLNPQIDSIKFLKKINLPRFYQRPFKLGLDLQGGTHLVYRADLSNIEPEDYKESMQGVKDVIERRVNIFGIAEPIVQITKVGNEHRLIVELAGVRDIKQAIEMIGETPYLEFRERRSEEETNKILEAQKVEDKTEEQWRLALEDPYFKPTPLTGKYLKRSDVSFDPNTYKPIVNLQFNDEGKDIFAQITKDNVGKQVAIYLDGTPISAPTVKEAITRGKAVITGDFSIEEAKQLVRRLNSGALPVPITLISQQSIGATLGEASLAKSLKAGMIGLAAIVIFMILFYRLPGLLAVLALLIYTSLVLAIFKLLPVTLTLAGIAGFILSMGMAVDANVLVFERMKEELKKGKSLGGSIDEGFKRAWTSIRDGNISTLITCFVLYSFTSSLVRGFALTLGIGVLVSMLSAIVVTRSLLRFFAETRVEGWRRVWGRIRRE